MTTTIIIGAGHAGSQCAISLRAEGYTGRIILINNDHEIPYHKPPLSKKYLNTEQPSVTPLRAATSYEKADISWIHSTVHSIDSKNKVVTLANDEKHSYDFAVIATGARNRTLDELNSLTNVFSLRTLADAEKLHTAAHRSQSFVILGGGFIGLEVAACLAAMGKSVHVIEAAERLLGRVVAPGISAKVHDSLTELGVHVKTNCRDSVFEHKGSEITGVSFSSDDALIIDAMLVGIGAIPNSELAVSAGLNCANGIEVNSALQTSDESIYAIGDCANYPHWQTSLMHRLESVQNAVDQAKHVASNIAKDEATAYRSVPWFWSDIGALKLQIAGIFSGDTMQVVREDGDAFALYHLQNDAVVCVESINSVKDHLIARKLIDAGVRVSQESIMAGPEALKKLL